jgi:hypothetical protein
MENAELIDFIFEKIKTVDASLTIIHSMLSDDVKKEYEQKITTSVDNMNIGKAIKTISDASAYVQKNRERYFQLRGELLSYFNVLEQLGVAIPIEYLDLLKD